MGGTADSMKLFRWDNVDILGAKWLLCYIEQFQTMQKIPQLIYVPVSSKNLFQVKKNLSLVRSNVHSKLISAAK